MVGAEQVVQGVVGDVAALPELLQGGHHAGGQANADGGFLRRQKIPSRTSGDDHRGGIVDVVGEHQVVQNMFKILRAGHRLGHHHRFGQGELQAAGQGGGQQVQGIGQVGALGGEHFVFGAPGPAVLRGAAAADGGNLYPHLHLSILGSIDSQGDHVSLVLRLLGQTAAP